MKSQLFCELAARARRCGAPGERASSSPPSPSLTSCVFFPFCAAQESLEGRLDACKGASFQARAASTSRLARLASASLQALTPALAQVETGHGGGVAFSKGATYVSDGLCSVVVVGEPHTDVLHEADDGLSDKQRVAWALLAAYASVADASFEELQQALLKGLSALTGSFALVMHDRTRHRVVAARDKAGAEQLLWGATADAALVFSTTTDSAIDQATNPQAFPPGCCFVSDVDADAYDVLVKGACPGALTSFARAPGKGPVRASSSSGGMCRIMSGTDLAQITSKMGRVPSFTDLAPASMRGAAR